jgi:protein SCO1/2
MKKIIFLSVLLTSVLISCNKAPEIKKSCCSTKNESVAEKPISGESVYNLTSTWTSQKGETFELSHFRDKTVIVAMVFTHCESACPRLVADMKRLESSLTKIELQKISFLLISMDPERDTPSRFREFAADHKLNDNWTLVSSSQEATTEIANVLGVRVKKLEDGGFDHSNVIFVLDAEGVIADQQDGFAVEQEEILKLIKLLVQ